MKHEKMRADIQKRLRRDVGFAACTLLFLGAAVSGVIPVKLADERASVFVSGFQVGLLCALQVAFLLGIVKYRRALKDETALKQLYYKENDERTRYIDQQVGRSAMSVTTVVLLVAAIVAGYFSITVFCTILAVAIVQCVIQIILRWFFSGRTSGGDAEE